VTPAERLVKARALIAGGWSGPELEGRLLDCADTSGRPCSEADEGLARYSVAAALAQVSENGLQILELEDALEAIASPVVFAERQAFARHRPEEVPALPAAELERLRLLAVSSIGRPTLEAWLADPKRQLGEVLKVFDRAIQKLRGAQ
jgi:hypothetical protein